jgi:hypothetical protein
MDASMNKLAMCLGFLGVFVLGCATASVLIDDASATPPSGTHQCAAFGAPYVNERDVAAGKADEAGRWLPEGWTPVGGANTQSIPVVIACRTAP